MQRGASPKDRFGPTTDIICNALDAGQQSLGVVPRTRKRAVVCARGRRSPPSPNHIVHRKSQTIGAPTKLGHPKLSQSPGPITEGGTLDTWAPQNCRTRCGIAPPGDLIKSKVHSFFANGNSISSFRLQSVARLAASRLLLVLQAPKSIHFHSPKISRSPVRTETSLDCRTALLVWPHKIHLKGNNSDRVDGIVSWRLVGSGSGVRSAPAPGLMPLVNGLHAMRPASSRRGCSR